MSVWTTEKDERLIAMFADDRSYSEMAAEFNKTIGATRSRICRLRKQGKLPMSNQRVGQTNSDFPQDSAIFKYIKNKPRTLEELCNQFDQCPKAMREFLDEMREGGY